MKQGMTVFEECLEQHVMKVEQLKIDFYGLDVYNEVQKMQLFDGQIK